MQLVWIHNSIYNQWLMIVGYYLRLSPTIDGHYHPFFIQFLDYQPLTSKFVVERTTGRIKKHSTPYLFWRTIGDCCFTHALLIPQPGIPPLPTLRSSKRHTTLSCGEEHQWRAYGGGGDQSSSIQLAGIIPWWSSKWVTNNHHHQYDCS